VTNKPLFKTTIVIWSDSDPSCVELLDLARDATDGDSFCSVHSVRHVQEPQKDPDWENTDFFDGDEVVE
jgi:hypothetical protein